MHKIFISGSMRIKNIDKAVINRVNNIINSKFGIIIGDADGVDSSIQNYLKNTNYDEVTVYCTGQIPRNNLGSWSINPIVTDKKPGTREYFTAKDLSMAKDCDFGLMIWDSKSTGTLSNVLELLYSNKKSLVFVNKLKQFFEITNVESFEKLISVMSEAYFEKADKKIKLRNKLKQLKNKQLELFD
ncbi:hypothetical protein [Desulfobacter postgatei]|uniref:Uncharacterized protein n=1 Tax=Desulfobacter postgatei 2ac9 TaxID=879212 RepID=I5AZZ8_9BACT|nr:hypothetical protein [Desulfobacter postgatei]EIM62811.1 hypothetical protein DespoDRAFT_00827 [Desulfobacter postgatei 2ac9]